MHFLHQNHLKHQSSASLAFVREIHWWPVVSPHKGPVTRKMFLFNDVIMVCMHWWSSLKVGIIMYLSRLPAWLRLQSSSVHMMTSSNGNIFCVTGPLCREFTSHRWIPLTKATDVELWCFLWSVPSINGWVNNREAGNSRHHHAHYDITVMWEVWGDPLITTTFCISFGHLP